MDFGILFKRAGKVAAENSPAILAALGVSGTLTTAYLAAKAAFKSSDVLREAEMDKAESLRKEYYEEHQDESPLHYDDENESPWMEPLTTQEKVQAVWKLYVPAAASAALTVAAIVLAVRVQDRRNAALAAAYTTVEKSYAEYRAKNLEKLGKSKEQKLRDEIAQDRINRSPKVDRVVIATGKGDTLCQDAWSGRFFTSSRNLVDKAVNEFNSQLNKDGFASLTVFYDLLGISGISESDYIGWRDGELMELQWSAVIDEDDEPALCFTFRNNPDARFASAY